MPEVGEDGSKAGVVKRQVGKLWSEAASRLKGESSLSRSIRKQKLPLKKIVEQHTDKSQVREAKRMLQVIDYYEAVLNYSPEEQQRRIRELEGKLKEQVDLSWRVIPQCTEFNLNDPSKVGYYILPPKEHDEETRTERWRRAKKGYAGIIFGKEFKGDEAEVLYHARKYVKVKKTEDDDIKSTWQAWSFYLEFQPTEERPYRQMIIQLDPRSESENISSVNLKTNKRGLKKQRANFQFQRSREEINIVPLEIMWQPVLIGNNEITGWDRYAARAGERDGAQEQQEKSALTFAIIQELIETTEVSEEEIRGLVNER